MTHKTLSVFLLLTISMLFCTCAVEPELEPIILAGTSWQVIELSGAPLVPGSYITMDFSDNLISGNASCNSYSALYVQDGSSLTITDVIATTMACVDQAPMTQEQRFTASLEQVELVEMNDGQLVLRLGDGGTIMLEAQ